MIRNKKSRNGLSSRTEAGSFSGTNLTLAGGHNQRATLQAIRVHSPITRLELAKMTGLTAPAIANITKRLIASGLIAEVGCVRGGRGQPAKMLAINPDGCFSIGVNIDRDHITIVALDLVGRVRARTTREVNFPLPAAVSKHFKKEVDYFFDDVGLPKDKVVGIGVAVPDDLSTVKPDTQPANYKIWGETDIEAIFTNVLDLPTFVENDATAAAIGEMQFGKGLQYPNFFYILLTWGLGGGVVLDGVYYRGADGRSGEIGFLPLNKGKKGAQSVQDIVSLSALYQFLSERGFGVSTPKEIEGYQPEIASALDEWAKMAASYLADAILGVNCLINPDAVLIGARLPAAVADTLVNSINRRLSKLVGSVPVICPVEKAAIAEDAPAVGAAILPFSDMLFPSRSALLKPAI